MNARASAVLRGLVGGAVLLLLVRQVGSAPVLEGLRRATPAVLVAGAALGLAATLCSAWRWRVVARSFGAGLALPEAVAASYRAQLLNVTLPGGVLGDVHRGVRHGYAGGDVGRGVRAVAWERAAGQAVQLGLAALALSLLPAPVHPALVAAPVVLVVVGSALVLAARRRGGARVRAAVHALRRDLARLAAGRVALAVVVASPGAVACYVAAFLVAARAAGVTAPVHALLAPTLLVLAAMSVPASVAGWGPREGVAAWVFAAAGPGAAAGLSTAVVYGVMTLVASLPGLVVLIAGRRSSRPGSRVEVTTGG